MPNPQNPFEDISAAALTWCGTPFVHGASLREAGADCLGVVLGVLREFGIEYQQPAYQPMPGEADETALLLALQANLLPAAEIRPGCVLLFRWRGLATHLGICTERGFVHAYFPAGKVVEVPLQGAWADRLMSAWEVPR